MKSQDPIRAAIKADATIIKSLAVESGLFSTEEVGFLDEPLEGFFNGHLADHQWLVYHGPDGAVIAAAYVAPESFADRMWNLYFIAVSPTAQDTGAGTALISHIEQMLGDMGEAKARTLIVETSSTDQFERTRAFYTRRGFVEEARIRQFYGPEEDKVVFWKSLAGTSSL